MKAKTFFSMTKYVSVLLDGKLTVHLPHTNGDYYTLCGLDGTDGVVGQEVVDVPKGAKVDCKDCHNIWLLAKEFSAKDFTR